jgi:DNA-binding Lrp family transcriptional regulator
LNTKGPKNGKTEGDGIKKVTGPPIIDPLDIKIVDELLADPDISSSKIATKYNIPLSTIQRRRATLESISSVLRHKYVLNPISFGLRPVFYWVMVERGKAEEISRHIFDKYDNVLKVSIQINSISNVGVEAYVDSSEALYRMLEEIKSMQFVKTVNYAEIVRIVDERAANFFKRVSPSQTH